MRKRFEYGVAALIFAALAIGYTTVYHSLSATVERYTVAANLSALEMAANMQIATRRVDAGPAVVELVASSNPFEWLDEPLEEYYGAVANYPAAAVELPPGGWLYVEERRAILYRPLYPRQLVGGVRGGGPERIEWQLEPTGRGGVSAEPVVPYRWRE
ncbi:hypothetical protein CKO15_10480 [Halorhodospira abdelmalekii]|uniref:hypothetical protein n=1 Tax=Halorhodospira abdelmalekii TaxID=421629 RepID=UPI00190563FF|nr:hypothetical protein [Halorhodospira abdelmalekii]MBK1735700.1 hypothetical protein [Halorhodospira abdelmalekii]